MPTDEDHRVFIFYAHRDGAALAARKRWEALPWWRRLWTKRPEPPAGI